MACTREHLTTWVSSETKNRFSAVARHEGCSDSALLKRLVELMLRTARGGEVPTATPASRQPRESRLTIRLRPDDQLLLRERAAGRGTPAATYVSALTRAHLRVLARLPKEELRALKRTIVELGSIGRNLNQIAIALDVGQSPPIPNRDDLRAMLKVSQGLRDRVKELLSANLKAWEQGYGEPRQSEQAIQSCELCAPRPRTARAHFSRGVGADRADGAADARSHGQDPKPRRASLKAVGRHFDYLRLREDREQDIETDDGRQLKDGRATKDLMEVGSRHRLPPTSGRPRCSRRRIEEAGP